jgi:hypothetical protein
MGISLKGFKVIYKEQVLNAVALLEQYYPEDFDFSTIGYRKFEFLTILIIDTNGNLKTIYDEAWMFQFIPIVTKECEGK